MTRFKPTSAALMALMAILALSASAVTIASAAEPTKMLPAAGITFTSKAGPGTLLTVGGTQFNCKEDKGTGTIDTTNLGNFHTEFKKCEANVGGLKGPCTGEGEAAEVILLLGTFHYWLATLDKALVGALVFLIREFHYTCEIFGVKQLLLVKGCEAALAEPTEKLTTVTKDVFKETKSGISDIRTVLPENSTKPMSCIRLMNINNAGFEESAQTGTIENEKFKKGAEAVEILLMNK
jgi:hypothetical protein